MIAFTELPGGELAIWTFNIAMHIAIWSAIFLVMFRQRRETELVKAVGEIHELITKIMGMTLDVSGRLTPSEKQTIRATYEYVDSLYKVILRPPPLKTNGGKTPSSPF